MRKVRKGDADRARIRSIRGMSAAAKNGLVAQSFVDNILALKTPMAWYRRQAENGTLRRLVNGTGEAFIQCTAPGRGIPEGYTEDYARKKAYPVNRNTSKRRATVDYVKSCREGIHELILLNWMRANFTLRSAKGFPDQDKLMRYALRSYLKKGLLKRLETPQGPIIVHPSAFSNTEQSGPRSEYRKPEQLELFKSQEHPTAASNEQLTEILREIKALREEVSVVFKEIGAFKRRLRAASDRLFTP